MQEQNFDFDLLTPQKLLEKYVGQQVSVVRTHPGTGQDSTETATVLSANQGVVLQIGQRIETGLPGRLVFDTVPPNLRDRPTLVLQLDNRYTPAQDVELSYLTGGLSWRADYVAELSPADDQLDITAWVTLSNTSGTSYHNARLQLVAGDVNRVAAPARPLAMARSVMLAAAPAPEMAEESLFEYHLYNLGRPTTVADNQSKQVLLLTGTGVPVRKELLLRGQAHHYQNSVGLIGQKMKAGVFIDFDNQTSAHLGLPLPKGVVRVYKKDTAGNAQFVGEDRLDHTPKNETVRLKLGDAFDITADKKQTDFKRQASPGKPTEAYESAFELILKNAKTEAVTVTLQEPIPGDWRMLSESQPHSKSASNLAVWRIRVPAQGSSTLSYRVLLRL